MSQEEALALAEQLGQFVARGPGANPDALREIRMIASRLRAAPEGNAYVREKLLEVAGDYDVWLSARKLERRGYDRAKGDLYNSLAKLRMAIQSFWRESAER